MLHTEFLLSDVVCVISVLRRKKFEPWSYMVQGISPPDKIVKLWCRYLHLGGVEG